MFTNVHHTFERSTDPNQNLIHLLNFRYDLLSLQLPKRLLQRLSCILPPHPPIPPGLPHRNHNFKLPPSYNPRNPHIACPNAFLSNLSLSVIRPYATLTSILFAHFSKSILVFIMPLYMRFFSPIPTTAFVIGGLPYSSVYNPLISDARANISSETSTPHRRVIRGRSVCHESTSPFTILKH